MSNEQKMREALQAYQDANEMSPYGDYSKIEWESSAGPVNPLWGGGDCKKHGRWYGRCYSCSDDWDNLRKKADRDAYTARENALNAAKQLARQALATTEPVMANGLTEAETDASASVSGLTAERDQLRAQVERLQGGEQVYQYQRGDGTWVDQSKSSYDYNLKNGNTNLRILYTAQPAAPAMVPLTKHEIADLWDSQHFHITDLQSAEDFVRDVEERLGIGQYGVEGKV